MNNREALLSKEEIIFTQYPVLLARALGNQDIITLCDSDNVR